MIVGFLVYKCLGWLICDRPHTRGVVILVFLVRGYVFGGEYTSLS